MDGGSLAASFVVVGAAVRAPPRGAGAGAAFAFVVWWWALAAYLASQGTLYVAASAGAAPFGAFLAARLLAAPLLTAAAGGLTYYLVVLFTGRSGARWPVALLYGACAIAYAALVIARGPAGVSVGRWTADLAYARAAPPLVQELLYLAIGLPPILGSLAYGSLAFRLRDPTRRYRAGLVSASILAWVGSGLAAHLGADETAQLATLVGAGSAAALGAPRSRSGRGPRCARPCVSLALGAPRSRSG